MSRSNLLHRSGTRLQRQGVLFFHQTRQAGELFVAETREAGATFLGDLTRASNKFVGTTSRSARGFGRAMRKEAVSWGDLVIETKEAYIDAVKARVERAEELATQQRGALRPEAVETRVLQAAHDLLDTAQSRVDERLKGAVKPTPKAAKAKPKAAKAKPKAAKTQPKAERVPIRNYDHLTAKDVVSRVQRLSGPQATAVLDYEKARKNRTTVIRAAKQRLSAAG